MIRDEVHKTRLGMLKRLAFTLAISLTLGALGPALDAEPATNQASAEVHP